MKNRKQPIYDKSNLIDFTRKNLWMSGIQKTSNPDVLFNGALVVLILTITYALFKIWS